MARRCFYSFHYKPDGWRAAKVRNMGVIEGNRPASDNDWETITRSGDAAIKRWINGQLSGRSCTVVLIGTNTAGRKWIDYEIEQSWNNNKGVLGIHIHKLTNSQGSQSRKGANPFRTFKLNDGRTLASVVKTYDPPRETSSGAYSYVKANLENWVETAVRIRRNA